MTELEEFEKWLEGLKEEDKLIIVEGESDKKALEQLGLKKVKSLSRKPLDLFAEKIEENVVLLLDFDVQGKKLTNELSKLLERRRIKYELKYWRLLPKLKISHIEGIDSRYFRLKNKFKK